MELKLYFQILMRGWWIILLTMLFALAGALGASYLATPQYEAIARFIVSPSSDLINRSDVVSSLNTLDNQSVVNTLIEVMSSDRIFTATLSSLQVQPDTVKNYIHQANVVSNSSVIEIIVTGPDPKLAANLANTIGTETIKYINRLNQVFSVAFLDIAVPPELPSSPQPVRNSAIALFLGLIVGVVMTFLSEQIRLSLEVFRQRFNLDSMTGVYNRKYFLRLVEDELAKNPDDVLTIGIVELVGISDLVDTIPVTSLQKAFEHVTDTLHKELRGNDIIGRWNEISFIIMLPNTPGIAANRIFGRIYQVLSEPVKLERYDLELNLDAHFGGAEYSDHISTQELFERANGAIEQSRLKNGTPVYVWTVLKPFSTAKKSVHGLNPAVKGDDK